MDKTVVIHLTMPDADAKFLFAERIAELEELIVEAAAEALETRPDFTRFTASVQGVLEP